MYDTIIIGAGIAGCSIAYFLKKRGQKVCVIERGSFCEGGSHAAGAFLSPKIGKPSLYKTFVNDALKFSLKLYEDNFPELLEKNSLVKLPKSDEDAIKCKAYEPFMETSWKFLKPDELDFLTKTSRKNGAYFFDDAGIVDAKGVCGKFLEDIDLFEKYEAKELKKEGDYFKVGGLRAEKVVLCVGAYDQIADIPYLNIRKICGHRIDAKTSTLIKYNIHKDISISATRKDSLIAIGATHIKGYECKEGEDCPFVSEKDELIERAKDIIDLQDFEKVKAFYGMRASSVDYFPILGELIDHHATLEKFPYIKTGAKVQIKSYLKQKNLFIHTGHGARGFVLAPYTAKLLADYIVEGVSLSKNLDISRLFLKWARKFQQRPS